MRLLGELLGRGGLAVECAGADAASRARLTLQPDGSTFLRCTGDFGSLSRPVAVAVASVTDAIGAASSTVASLRALADILVFCAALSTAAGLLSASATVWEAIGRPLLVAAAYAALVPLRGPLLRLILRRALRLAFKLEG